MIKQILLLMALLISATMQGQVSKALTDLTPGQLITKMTATEFSTVTNLTLSGTIDARDFLTIRQKMPQLAVVDLTNVTIAEYTGTGGAQSGALLTFPANALPGGALIGMTSLTSVTLPANITSIGNGSFQNNVNLSSINIPLSITSIEDRAFTNCRSLTVITIPAAVTSIGINAFTESNIHITVDSENLNYSSAEGVLFNKDQTLLIYCPPSKSGSYRIPSTVKSMSDGAFFICSGLTSVIIPESITAIGFGVFSNCTALKSVNIPNTVTTIGNAAFIDCKSLTSIDIPTSVTSIGEGAFAGCASLSSVTIPESITTIAKNTFTFCTALTSVRIPGSVTDIGSDAFNNCPNLTAVTLPNSVTSIGECAFSRCSGLSSVILPESVTIIANGTFSSCTGLTSVTIPASVTSIEENAFNRCTQLASIYAYPVSPVNLPSVNVFGEVNKNTCTLYVPDGSKELYLLANVWKSFTRINSLTNSSSKEISNRVVSIWPNPAKDKITIHAEKGLVNIYSSNGKLEISQSIENNQQVNISSLSPGMHIVVVKDESYKIIKE